jgi:hypothetical protein
VSEIRLNRTPLALLKRKPSGIQGRLVTRSSRTAFSRMLLADINILGLAGRTLLMIAIEGSAHSLGLSFSEYLPKP